MTDASGDARRPRAATCIPALENGDRLTRCEFERRYAARPDLKKAELIEGVVYMPSPVRLAHSGPHAMIQTALLVYTAFTPGVRGDDNATVRLDLDNEPQPDVLLRIEEEAGGQSRVSDDGYLEGAPELVVEVAASSASIGATVCGSTSSGGPTSSASTGSNWRTASTGHCRPTTKG